ncbi:ABC transporter permease [Nocardioides sp. GY 10127]|uniref:ABC transporter permease n=1 Tax=Nocardioides sp. GY 10127 TaxID=2569762 RepID=UPI0010A80B9A|nr:ABC transporter permease [Nocardioides sp. GY 10127]TIC85691.1 ABC transporter permease [Nocardioides sp. GY 10127]
MLVDDRPDAGATRPPTSQTTPPARRSPATRVGSALGGLLAMVPTWLLVVVLFLVPIVFLAVASLATFNWDTGKLDWVLTFENYTELFRSSTFVAFKNSIFLSVVATIACVLIGYPIAYAISLTSGRAQKLLLLAVITPFWTAFVVRVYAWLTLLGPGDLVPWMLSLTGLTSSDLDLTYTNTAVLIGIVYCYLPLSILPVYSVLEQIDRNLVLAAYDLGYSPAKAWFKVTLPLSLPGVAVSALLVGIPCLGEYTIPAVLGGGKTLMIGNLVTNAFTGTGNYAAGAAIAMLLLAVILVANWGPRGIAALVRLATRVLTRSAA